jgi:catechol 2,3-dioxygenase-like lactoylglutathione lyase family enzyme
MSEPIELLSFRPNLLVRDVAAATAFYRDVIGLPVHAEFPDGSFAMLGGHGGAEVALVLHEDPQPGEAYLYVKGAEALLARCEAAGFEIVRPLTTQPWGLVDFVVRDPDGHLIGIGERVGEED